VNKGQEFYHDEAPKKRRNKTNSALHKFQKGIPNKSKEIYIILYLEIWHFEARKMLKNLVYLVIHNITVAEPFVMVGKSPPPGKVLPTMWW
jgi:hypothetical protein